MRAAPSPTPFSPPTDGGPANAHLLAGDYYEFYRIKASCVISIAPTGDAGFAGSLVPN